MDKLDPGYFCLQLQNSHSHETENQNMRVIAKSEWNNWFTVKSFLDNGLPGSKYKYSKCKSNQFTSAPAVHTIALTPSGYRNLLYRVLRVSSGSTSHSLISNIGPVSKPSSGQKIVKPAFLSPCISVLNYNIHVHNINVCFSSVRT